MPSRTLVALLSAVAVVALAVPGWAEDSAADIVQSAIDQNSTGLQGGIGQMTVLTEDKAGDKKRRVLSFKGKSADTGRRTLVRLLEPDEVKGQAFLFVEVKNGEDQVHWYLPAFGVTRRIQGGKKNGSFLGTHFTYADLESRDIKDSAYKTLAAEKIGKHDVHVIEATPKKSSDSEYSKVTLYIRKSDKMLLKARFKAKKGSDKVLFVEKIDERDGTRYVQQMTLRPSDGGFTRITIDSIDVNATVPDVVFTPESLGNE